MNLAFALNRLSTDSITNNNRLLQTSREKDKSGSLCRCSKTVCAAFKRTQLCSNHSQKALGASFEETHRIEAQAFN